MNINAKEGEINFSLEYKRKLHEEGTGAALDLGLEEWAGFEWEEVEGKPFWAEETVWGGGTIQAGFVQHVQCKFALSLEVSGGKEVRW